MIHTLYKTTNLKNNRIYIGVHESEDLGFGTETWVDPYVGSGVAIEKSLKKYGRANFIVEVISYFDDRKDAYLAEVDIVTIGWLKSMGRRTYNRTPGGYEPPIATWKVWITDGFTDRRVANNYPLAEGWSLGRSKVKFSESELERRRQLCVTRNTTNNPSSNSQNILKMSTTKKAQYANGSVVIHNKGLTGKNLWITNGIKSNLISVEEPIPVGWRKGRTSLNIGKKYNKRKINAIAN